MFTPAFHSKPGVVIPKSRYSGFCGSGIQSNLEMLDYQGFQVRQCTSFQGKLLYLPPHNLPFIEPIAAQPVVQITL